MGRSLSMFKTLLSVDYVCPRHVKSTKWVGIRKLWSKLYLFGTYRAKKASKKVAVVLCHVAAMLFVFFVFEVFSVLLS